MKITVMCAVPFKRIDYAPECVDRRGGQIYHDALPGLYMKTPSSFAIGVALSFLLEYEPEDVEVSHLECVMGTAKMFGEVISKTQNDFVLNPCAPLGCKSTTQRLATYENIPLHIECSCDDFGLIELSWALKVDTYADPVEARQTVHVRSWTHPDVQDAISSEEYDAWQKDSLRTAKPNKPAEPSLLGFMPGPTVWFRERYMRRG